MNLFELTLQINGFPITEAKSCLKEIQEIPEEKFEAYVKNQRLQIVNHHLKENQLYRKFLGMDLVSNWEEVPVMHKSDLQKPLEQRLSMGFTSGNCYVNKTSGSSGHPFIFAKDKFCHALTWAEIIDRYAWFGVNFNSSLQARFYGIPLDFMGYQKERLKDLLSHRYRFPIFDLSNEKLESYLKVFKRKKFYYINGYTSSIVLFAKFLNEKNITLNTICPTLKYCIVTSEMLFDSDLELMEITFGVPVINEYGASELDLIAFTNRQNEFIVNSETLYVEILDKNDQPLPYGKAGRIVITSLYNKAHPLIRYDIGDTGILMANSSFKKPILQQLIGRTNDVAQLPSGKTVPGLTFYYVTKSVIEDDGNVKEFIIEQSAINSFTIRYVSERELSLEETKKITLGLEKYLEINLDLNLKRESYLDRSANGKLKQFSTLIHEY